MNQKNFIKSLSLACLLTITIIFPPFMMMLGASSFALGLFAILVSYVLAAIIFRKIIIDQYKVMFKTVGCILFIIFFHGVISFYLKFEYFNLSRFLTSFFYLILFISGSFSFYLIAKNFLFKSSHVIYIVFYFFILIALLSFIGLSPFQVGGKPMFFYSEPSHFAQSFIPLLLCIVVLANQKAKFMYLIIGFEIALIAQNLTLLLGIMLVSVILIRARGMIFLVCSYLILFVFDPIVHGFLFEINPTSFFVINHQDLLSYILARVPINSAAINSAAINSAAINSAAINSAAINSAAINSNNGSLLLFLFGWERAWLNLIDFYGLGIGFQQLGFVGRLGVYGQHLGNIYNPQLGLLDGGTVGSKLISEFGLIGIFGLSVYLLGFSKIIKKLRLASTIEKSKENCGEIFFNSIYVAYFIDIFVRGLGYFTPSSFLFLAALFFISQELNKHSIFWKEKHVVKN